MILSLLTCIAIVTNAFASMNIISDDVFAISDDVFEFEVAQFLSNQDLSALSLSHKAGSRLSKNEKCKRINQALDEMITKQNELLSIQIYDAFNDSLLFNGLLVHQQKEIVLYLKLYRMDTSRKKNKQFAWIDWKVF